MDLGSVPTNTEDTTRLLDQGQGQGTAMAGQQGATRSGPPTRTYHSMQAAEDHIRQQHTIITEQARNLEILSDRMDAMTIQLAQLLSLIRRRWGSGAHRRSHEAESQRDHESEGEDDEDRDDHNATPTLDE